MQTFKNKSEKIFKLNKDLNHFIKNNSLYNSAFENYKRNLTSEQSVHDFIFEKIFNENKSIIDLYLENNINLPDEDIKHLKEIKASFISVFEVKNIAKNEFKLYNLVNEKIYDVQTLGSIVNYRGITCGSFLSARIIPFEGQYYFFSIDKVHKNSLAITAYEEAVKFQTKNTGCIYLDNEEKLVETEKNVSFLKKKFEEFFEKEVIITNNNKLNDLLNAFNEFVDGSASKEDIRDFIENPEKQCFFDISKNPNKTYDIAVIFDPSCGLFTIPFYATFCKIFEIDDYKKISGYKNCIKSLLKDKNCSPYILKKVYEQYRDVFLDRIQDVIGIQKNITFEDLINKYKKDFIENKKFSTPTILYSSEAFETYLKLSEEKPVQNNHHKKIGRNDPCFCNSGKKYKNCCLKRTNVSKD